jgi:hypothetical protein
VLSTVSEQRHTCLLSLSLPGSNSKSISKYLLYREQCDEIEQQKVKENWRFPGTPDPDRQIQIVASVLTD